MKEEWKPVQGYEGKYEVSNAGRVRRIVYRVLSPYESDGYLDVSLCDGKGHKSKRVHRLVAEAFIPNPEGKTQVNHIDFNKKHNYVSNLEWCDGSENVQHNYDHGKTKLQKRVQCLSDGKIFVSQSEAARYYGISQQTVSALCRAARTAVNVPDFRYYDEHKAQNKSSHA